MKKSTLCIVVVICFIFYYGKAAENNTIKAEFFSPLRCAIILLPSSIGFAPEFAQALVKDFQFTNQFTVTVKTDGRAPWLIMKEYAAQKTPFVLFFKELDGVIDWWLYDGLGCTKIKAGRYEKVGKCARGWAHQIADLVWQELTGRPGFFGTRITYCKESRVKRGISLKSLCIADYDGTHEQVLVDSKTVLLAPRWHEYAGRPLIFYSEESIKNTRLLSIDLNKNCSIVSNNPGINMLISFNRAGTQAVYSASDQFGYSQIVWVQSKGVTPITSYKANSLGPVITDDAKKIYFYSDAFTRTPQICVYDCVTGAVKKVTEVGYNVGPAYNSRTGCIAYTGIRGGCMQIFLLDPASGVQKQLTTDHLCKEDCSWSPGGDFLLVCVTRESSKRLALYNIVTGQYTYITDARYRCSDPHWSPRYKEFPIVFD